MTDNNTLYQYSVLSALMAGLYDGGISIEEIKSKGDFGVGTFEELDGEMIAFDGEFYQMRSDGSARRVSDSSTSPFAAVTFFKEEKSFNTLCRSNKLQLQELILEHTPDQNNNFIAIRMDGEFEDIIVRTVPKQSKPYKGLAEVTNNQPTFRFDRLVGTVVGIRSPEFSQGISVAGHHWHFISEDRKRGGHIIDISAIQAVIRVATMKDIHIRLPIDKHFNKADLLKHSASEAIKKAEG
ncbi:alpha-acetolactate decarboxylase [Acrasis kona]|uniref:Alpha-acetolactate decarboxylase n=1 Tax=Acrasis kona TaxID=1008807 RepID=A0AAW2ZMU1_9EUKA